jgi:DNA-binding beta-propeller fold protein YncE
MKRLIQFLLTATLSAGIPASAQEAPEIRFDSAPNPLQLPADIYLGEVGGVATNSRGDIFVYTRTGHPTITIGTSRPFAHGGSRLFEFDRSGKYIREIGKDSYGFMVASQVRIDPSDNIWVVDEMTNMVMKFDPQFRVAMLLGRKAENVNVPAGGGRGRGNAENAPAGGGRGRGNAENAETPARGGGGRGGRGNANGAGQPTDLFDRPTDVAWDSSGNIFVADGLGNARIAKFDKDGKFVKSWGQKGTATGEFANVRSIAIDAQGNVYAADGGNRRVQVFDNNGNFKTAFTNVGNAQALCLTKGANPVLYVSNSNPPDDIDRDGEIYKMRLDGTIIGKFGRAGKLSKEFGTVNAVDCSSENTLYVAEIGNLRVQKLLLH